MSHKAQALSVSIVIPVYNEEDYLKDCLDSIASQTVVPDEVIVVDNGSTDATTKIAKQYPFVKLIHEKKRSVLYARTAGFNMAKSDIIGRIDADTILDANWVEHLKRVFTNPDIAGVTGPLQFYDMPFAPQNYIVDHFFKGPLYKLDKNFPFLFGTNMAISQKAWRSVRDELCDRKDINEDSDIAIHLYLRRQHLLYDVKLRAGMSSRRYDDSLRQFVRYEKMQSHTYAVHGLNPTGSWIARTLYMVGFVLLWPLRRSYNHKTRRRSIKHLLRGGSDARKNPMDS